MGVAIPKIIVVDLAGVATPTKVADPLIKTKASIRPIRVKINQTKVKKYYLVGERQLQTKGSVLNSLKIWFAVAVPSNMFV